MKILLVEDDEIDIEFFKRNLRKESIDLPVEVALNGQEALEILRAAPKDRSAVQEWIIITDINMPLMNGIEFLRELRADLRLNCCVAFVLTSSHLTKDQRAAYEVHAAGYFSKTKVHNNFSALVNLLKSYKEIALLPSIGADES